MNELDRIAKRKKRRQYAFQALNEMDDLTKALVKTFQGIEDIALGLKKRRFLFFATRTQESDALLGFADRAAPLLEEISGHVQAIRGEFSALQQSDERERQELEALLNNLPKEK
jgi:hypothetical protein